jgi:saccharopine dehydrogenase (NAD+, L-lysine-forming)
MNFHGRLPYTDTVDELTQFFLDYRAQVYKSGKWTKAGTYITHQFDFGPGVGKRACYSMFLEELEILPRLFPDLQDTGLYIASTGWLLDALTVPIMLLLKIAPRAAFRPMGRLLWWAMTSVSLPPYRIVLQVEAAGSDADGHRSFRTQLQHEDGYEFTAIPVAAFLQQFGQIRCPGLHLMGHLCDPQRLIADMQRMGIILTQTEI